MAQITLREILGHENPAISRFSINQNFKTLENSWNTLQNHINTSVPGAAGDLSELLLRSNDTNTLNFRSEGSGQFEGSLKIGINNIVLGANGDLDVNGNASFNGDLKISGDGGGDKLTIGSADAVDITMGMGSLVDQQFIANGTVPLNLPENIISAANKRVIWLENTNVLDANKLVVFDAATVLPGQRFIVMMADNQYVNNEITIDLNTTDVPNPVFGGVGTEWINQWVELVFNGSSWRRLGGNLV